MRPTLPTRRPIESAPILPPVAQCQPVYYRDRNEEGWAYQESLNLIMRDDAGKRQPHACGIAPAVLAPLRLED